VYNHIVQEISVSDFRQQCLALMDRLPAEGVLITRHGHPVAKIVPVHPASCRNLIGTMNILRDNSDDLFSTGERWDAES
jgi:prevent-host-death family protein